MAKEITALKALKDEIIFRRELLREQQKYLKELLNVLKGLEDAVSKREEVK